MVRSLAAEYPVVIEETPPQLRSGGPATRALAESYLAAVDRFDLRGARRLIVRAGDDGVSLGRLYVDVVRPALQRSGAGRLTEAAPTAERVMLGSAQAALAAVASRPAEGAAMHGRGRQALVSVGAAPLDALDGQVIVDVLCGDGWTVTEVPAGTAADQVAAMATDRHVEVVIMPTARAADLLLSAATYTVLRRMADPPVIVACSFGRPDETRRARAAGADAFVADPEDLLALLERRLPADGTRNWGVRMRRLGATLVVTPTGSLDDASVRRLRQVVDSREGTFDVLVVDTRDVASVSHAGAVGLVGWLRAAAGGGRAHRVLPGALFDAASPALEASLVASASDVDA